ncbi:helix-turn-helix domain-containing protein [Nocardia sp. NPDC020380]|uniref:helix-turn-helix domain-containing protein n=1 Tax=Nocardia sp. NPDC020380 TaxID=3364309 RepID=UPI00379BAE46
MTTDPSSAAHDARRALGARLRELRTGAALTIRELGTATGQHFTRVSKIENGVQPPSDRDIWEWCKACNADDQVADLLATLHAVDTAYLEFRRESRAGMKRVLGAHTLRRYEQTTVFRIYEHNVIPGLFQTPTTPRPCSRSGSGSWARPMMSRRRSRSGSNGSGY